MDTLADLTKDFPNLPSGDLNQVWKVLSQLQNSNPEKYRQFLDHLKSEKEKQEQLDELVPIPWIIYQMKATLLNENFMCYINLMAWERIKYPEEDQPISLMIGAELMQERKGELTVHVAVNNKAVTEIQQDRDLEKDFRSLIVKFISDNYPTYRFYSNTIHIFDRQNDIQYYGKLPEDPKVLFMKKKKADLTQDDLLSMLKKEKIVEPEPEIAQETPTLIDALELEMKNAKILDEPEETKQAENNPLEEKKIKQEAPSKSMLIEEVSEDEIGEIEPAYKVDNSNPNFYKIMISIPNASFDEVLSHVSSTQLIIQVPNKYKLEVSLPKNLKDESVKARFNAEKSRLTLKIPKLEVEQKDEPTEMFDSEFITNLQRGMGVKPV